jgi:hypothetical protein
VIPVREYRPTRLTCVVTFALGVVAAVGAVALPAIVHTLPDATEADRAAGWLVASLAAAIAVWAVLRARQLARSGIALEPDGLRSLDPAHPEVRLAWSDVRELRERPLLGRVEVASFGDAVRIPLEFQLEGFEELLGAVVERTPHANPPRPLPASFRGGFSGYDLAVLAGAGALGLAGVAAGLASGHGTAPLAGVALVLLTGLLLTLRTHEVTVESDALHLASRWRTRRLPLADLSAVRLGLLDVGNQKKVLAVHLEREGGTRIPLRPGGIDPFALYRTLAGALTSHASPP